MFRARCRPVSAAQGCPASCAHPFAAQGPKGSIQLVLADLICGGPFPEPTLNAQRGLAIQSSAPRAVALLGRWHSNSLPSLRAASYVYAGVPCARLTSRPCAPVVLSRAQIHAQWNCRHVFQKTRLASTTSGGDVRFLRVVVALAADWRSTWIR